MLSLNTVLKDTPVELPGVTLVAHLLATHILVQPVPIKRPLLLLRLSDPPLNQSTLPSGESSLLGIPDGRLIHYTSL